MFRDAGISEEHYLLRDRWHNEEDNYVELTNRVGMINVGIQDLVDKTKPCYLSSLFNDN